jgi:hypothetical protein
MGSVEGFAGGIYASPVAPARPQPMSATATPVRKSNAAPTMAPTVTFRETLEYFCQKHQIMFLPSTKTHVQSGKQIIMVGRVAVYLDGDVVFAENPQKRGHYIPVSFDDLLSMQQ